jgi:hypothetical protein
MKKGKVISPFRDKFHFNVAYEVGAVVEFDDERMQSLFDRQLCEEIKESESTPAPKKTKKTSKKDADKVESETSEKPEAQTEEVSAEADDEKAKSEQAAAEILAKATQKKD